MLQHFNWNKDKLLESYLENPELTCKKSLGVSTAELKTSQLTKGTLNCLVCLEQVPASKTMSLSCKHLYCTDCWKDYLEVTRANQSISVEFVVVFFFILGHKNVFLDFHAASNPPRSQMCFDQMHVPKVSLYCP